MTTTTKYPTTINQTSGGHYRQFKDTVNIRNPNSYYAISNNVIQKKTETYNRPSTLTLTNFKFNLPVGAVVKKVIVEYNHRKIGISNSSPSVSVNTKMNIPAPTITLVGVSGYSGKGQAPTNNWKAQTKTFKTDIDRTKINNSNFGVKINYPANTTNEKGYIGIQYIRIRLEYVTPSYGLTIQKAAGGYNKDLYAVQINLSNKNRTNHNPTVSVTAPPGLTIRQWNTEGTVNKTSTRTLDWKPKLTSKIGSQYLNIVFATDVTYPTGTTTYTGTLTASENYSNIIRNHTVTITDKPIDPTSDTSDTPIPPTGEIGDGDIDPTQTIVNCTINEPVEFTMGLSNETYTEMTDTEFMIITDDSSDNILAKEEGMDYYVDISNFEWYKSDFSSDSHERTISLKCTSVGEFHLNLCKDDYSGELEVLTSAVVRVKPLESSLSTPYHALFTPSAEEKHRLGDGYSYTVQSYLNVSGQTTYYEHDGTITHTKQSGDETTLLSTLTNLPQDFITEFDIKTSSGEGGVIFSTDTGNYTESSHYFGILFTEVSNTLTLMYDEDLMGYDLLSNLSRDTYSHIKIVRSNGAFSIYVDGTLKTTEPISWFSNYNDIYLSTYVDTGSLLVKDISISKGSGDTYVRDWYKNFRIGVFNNRIESNCTDYICWDTDETSQDRGIVLSAVNDLTGASLILSVDKAVDITIDGTTYELSDSDSETLTGLTDYTQPLTIAQNVEDTVNLTATLKDSNDNTLQVIRYIVKFNQTSYKEPYEYTSDSTDYSSLIDSQILSNAGYWSPCPTKVNTYENLETAFMYEQDYPLYIIIVGDYMEADNIADIKFTEPCIVETRAYTQQESNGNYPTPIDNSIIGDGSVSELVMEAQNQSSPFVFYKLELDDDYGTNEQIAIRGIELTADIEHSDELVLYATLRSPTGATGSRSIVLNESTSTTDNTNTFSIGGIGDLWGFSTLDLLDLNSWELELTTSNILNDEQGTLNFGNVNIIFYIEQIDNQQIICKINDENIAYYGGFITDVNIPAGLKTDTNYLSIDGTDTNDAYRQNIREKEITLELNLDGCDLEATTLSLQQLVKLLVNEKDKYNRPIPKRIEFSHYPNIYWEYIIEDTIDTNIEISDYSIKAKLTIPSGTAYNKNSTTTNTLGYVQGLAAINPIITLTPSGSTIEITENNTKQSFKMTYNNDDWTGKIVEIDCEDRIVWLKTDEDDSNPINITGGVDFNSDWFALKGEYQFSSVNSTIRTIDYVERW